MKTSCLLRSLTKPLAFLLLANASLTLAAPPNNTPTSASITRELTLTTEDPGHKGPRADRVDLKASVAEPERQIVLAQSFAADVDQNRFFHLDIEDPSRRPPSSLILPNAELSEESADQLREDLAIMSRLLQKAADPTPSRGQGPWALGIPVFGLGSQRSNQNIYLEGYGILFLHSVPFPLQPEDPTNTQVDAASKQKDSPWDQAKREVLGGKSSDPGNRLSIGWEHRFDSAEFDATKLEALKEAMIETLKQSANIRILKPEERLTVVFSGPVARTAKKGKKQPTTADREPTETTRPAKSSEPSPRTSSLVFRVRKADAEAALSGKLDDQAFKTRVEIRSP